MTHEKICGMFCLIMATLVPAAQAGTFKYKELVNYYGAPEFNMVQGFDGNLYGTSWNGLGGPTACNTQGCAFRMTPSGAYTTIYNFCTQTNCPDGANPNGVGTLALDTSGNFYGTTQNGGAFGYGTIFTLTPGGALNTLYSFCSQPNCADGGGTRSGVTRGADGNFYGVTPGNGANNNEMCTGGVNKAGCGTVFRITPEGAFSTLYSFCGLANCADGDTPHASLISGRDGNLYGLTSGGGAFGGGTIFKLTLDGTLTTLHSFDKVDGAPGSFNAPMTQGDNGTFYGTTQSGGANNSGALFEVTSQGAFTLRYSFCSQSGCPDGSSPEALVQASDGNLYGATGAGGSGNWGTLFSMSPSGTLTTLLSYSGGIGQYVGAFPTGMIQATNGNFYGETSSFSTIFRLSLGLRPFVELLPGSGKVGRTVQILGNNLTSATSVTFNGTAAAFTVESATLISATVPAGATTGFVTVTTPSSTLKSNERFVVRP